MNFTQLVLLEQIVLIPISIYLIRSKNVSQLYRPLFIFLCVKEIAELTSFTIVVGFKIKNNAPPYNIMYLLEAVLLTWQLYNIGAFKHKKNIYIALQVFWLALWISDMFFIGSFLSFNIVFRIGYNFILLFVTAALLSKVAITIRHNIFRHTAFLLCITFLFWFLYNIVYEFSFKILALQTDEISMLAAGLKKIAKNITIFIAFAEALVYLIIAWAFYCIPYKIRIQTI